MQLQGEEEREEVEQDYYQEDPGVLSISEGAGEHTTRCIILAVGLLQ